MLRFVLLFNLILCPLVMSKRKESSESGDDLGGNLVSALRNDVNLDLSMDEEYEDLRAELLAYHTALASLATGRRSMKTTPCWKLKGICVEHKMCIGHRFLTEVAGCKSNMEVCCFAWNKFHVRDMRDEGIGVVAMPWSNQREIGGKGVIGPQSVEELKLSHHSNPEDGALEVLPLSHSHHNRHDQQDHRQHHYHHEHQDHHDKISGHSHRAPKLHDSEENSPFVVILRTKKK